MQPIYLRDITNNNLVYSQRSLRLRTSQVQFTTILNYSKRAMQYTQCNPHDTYVIVKELSLCNWACKGDVPVYTKSAAKKTALMLIAMLLILVFPANVNGYIAESAVPFDIDIAHKCDKPGLDRCYDLGLQAGLFGGYQHHGHLRYSIRTG
jgi:hypothetical protein